MTPKQIEIGVLTECQQWIGTPYIHQASLKGIGADCLGLVRGIWRHLYGNEPEIVPAYSSDWGEVSGEETIIDAAKRNFEIVTEKARPADLLVFRWRSGAIAKHVGILSNNEKFVHAYEGAGVVKTSLSKHWKNRIVGVYRFPTSPSKRK